MGHEAGTSGWLTTKANRRAYLKNSNRCLCRASPAVTRALDISPCCCRKRSKVWSLRDDGWYVDATYGRGGHSAEILARLGSQGRLLALDKDADAVADARRAIRGRRAIRDSSRRLRGASRRRGAMARRTRELDGVLFDLGVSSPQLDEPARGFSFAHDGPLDMRMNTAHGATAAEWLANVSQTELADVLFRYGEEPRARQIAAAIVRRARREPLTTTRAARESRRGARRPARQSGFIPATRAFQAIRIALNDELGALERGLAQSLALLGARRAARRRSASTRSRTASSSASWRARRAATRRMPGLPNIPPHARPRLKLVGKLVRPGADESSNATRARAARACASPSASRSSKPHEQARMHRQAVELVGVLAARRRRRGVGRLDRRASKHRVAAAVHRARGAQSRARPAADRLGATADRAEHAGRRTPRIEALARERLQSHGAEPTTSSSSSASRRVGHDETRVATTTVVERARWRSALLLAAFALVRCRARGADSLSAARRQGVSRRAGERPASAHGADLRASRLADGSLRRAARRQHARRHDLRQSEGARRPRSIGSASSRTLLGQDEEWLARKHHEQPRHASSSTCSGTSSPQKSRASARARAAGRRHRARVPPLLSRGRGRRARLGFTNVDDRGQEGLEAAFDHWLKGENGSKRVLQDRRGRSIGDVELICGGAPGPRLAHEHRSAPPISRVPRAQGRRDREPRALGLGRRARSAHGRSARDGESAVVQPERPRAISAPSTIATAPSPTSSSRARASSRS